MKDPKLKALEIIKKHGVRDGKKHIEQLQYFYPFNKAKAEYWDSVLKSFISLIKE